MPLKKQHVLIISPALAKANNGNWQTAQRWAAFLQPHHRVQCLSDWNESMHPAPDLIIALHARKSASAIAAFAKAFPGRPVILILTGTDLYRDIRFDEGAQQSMALATRLVVLQPAGLDEFGPELRRKAQAIFQSASPPAQSSTRHDKSNFQVIMIGHLRTEKRPDTFMQAANCIEAHNVKLVHIGGVIESWLGEMASQTDAAVACYTWLGPLPHAQTQQQLRDSALMVISSEMEGGANVIIEAVTNGVPVLASDIAGNRGMLGQDYAGYFPLGDASALASMIERAAIDPAFQALLQAQCARRAELFSPAHERAAVLELANNCLNLFPDNHLTGYP